ncbi:autotransporter outer membrane beta-barrel domain-containing protein [Pontiella desulfatans]|nr:hypothetical protein [Pontiella desulfatans]
MNVPVWGLDLPPIPPGETLTAATFSVDVLSISGAPLFFDVVFSLMNATDISQIGSAEFVAASAPLGTVLSNGYVFAQLDESEIPAGETLEVPVTGAALTQLSSLYDASGNPTQSTIWFRLSPSITNSANGGDRIQFADDPLDSNAALFGLELDWGVQPEDVYYVASTPTNWTAGSAWSDGNPPSSINNYIVTNNVALQTPSTTATFPGASLDLVGSQTVELMVSGADVITFPLLDLGSDVLRAGVVDAGEAKVDGTINVFGNPTLAGATNETRDLRVLALVTGVSTLELSAPTKTVYIDNTANTFGGTWNVTGGTAEFAAPGAVGPSGIQVQSNATLRILGNWDGLASGETLTVADSPSASVVVGANAWSVSALSIGTNDVASGAVYTLAELNAMGSNAVFAGTTGTIQVGALPPPPPEDLIVGIDTFDSTSAPTPTFTGAGITASATAFSPDGIWNNSVGEARGSSKDGTWGTFDGNGNPASTSTTLGVDCISLLNGRNGQITLSITNNGPSDINLGAIHFDALAFRAKAARTYAVNVLTGSDITVGNVFTSADQAITELNGTAGLKLDDLDPETHDQHDDIDVSLAGIADSTLEVGGVAIIELAFSGGIPGNSGHHLWVDNLGISSTADTVVEPPEPPVMGSEVSGGNMTITWTSDGSFKLQTRDSLTTGDWMDVPGATSSPVVVPATNDVEFLRLIEQ